MKIVVNMITTLRFISTLILPIVKTKMTNTFFVTNIIILFLTDLIDGVLARKYNVQTLYGSIMDTIADKTLCIVLLFLLIPKVDISIIVLLNEMIIALINTIGLIKGKNVKSSIMGKIKMWILSITIVLGYLFYFNLMNFNILIISNYITIIAQVLVIIDYIRALKKQKGYTKPKYKIKNVNDLKYILFNTNYYLSTL